MFFSEFSYTIDYIPCVIKGENCVFIGQVDQNGKPNGIGRAVNAKGQVYEG